MTMLSAKISSWIENYTAKHKINGLTIGISGGIDSSVVSKLCANTGLPTTVVSMPIHQNEDLHSLSILHSTQLLDDHINITHHNKDLTDVFDVFVDKADIYDNELAFANSKSRLRMMYLYQIAQSTSSIVVGTGNKVEDFGVGFFTKYGDGGVDISPIADLTKTEVWNLGKELGIDQQIIDAIPTDGLWEDNRTDIDQLGLTYQELEQAMYYHENSITPKTDGECANLIKYKDIRNANLHKMIPIPTYKEKYND